MGINHILITPVWTALYRDVERVTIVGTEVNVLLRGDEVPQTIHHGTINQAKKTYRRIREEWNAFLEYTLI